MLEDVANAGAESALLDCEVLLNLRDFRSEALVLGNGTILCLDDEAEGGYVVDVDVWVALALAAGFSFVSLFFNEAPDAQLMRRFFWGRRLFVLSDIGDVVDAEVDGVRVGGGAFWHLSTWNIRGENQKESYRLTNVARSPLHASNRGGRRWHRLPSGLFIVPNDGGLRWPTLRS